MNVIADLDEACQQLTSNTSPDAIAARWGRADESAKRLILVAPSNPVYEEIQVLVGPTGRVTQIVFDFPSVSPMHIDDLAAAYGEGNEDTPSDGPLMIWFRPPRGHGCEICAAVQMRAPKDRTTRQVSVVAPYRP